MLNARTGALRDSVKLREDNQSSTSTVEIGADGSAPYDAIQEYGGKTAAHEIIADKAEVLAFMLSGKQVFARRVNHPDRPFLNAPTCAPRSRREAKTSGKR